MNWQETNRRTDFFCQHVSTYAFLKMVSLKIICYNVNTRTALTCMIEHTVLQHYCKIICCKLNTRTAFHQCYSARDSSWFRCWKSFVAKWTRGRLLTWVREHTILHVRKSFVAKWTRGRHLTCVRRICLCICSNGNTNSSRITLPLLLRNKLQTCAR